jgi:hypothetical protein
MYDILYQITKTNNKYYYEFGSGLIMYLDVLAQSTVLYYKI